MSESMAILQDGKGTAWRVTLADKAIEYKDDGYIYRQTGIGIKSPALAHRRDNERRTAWNLFLP